MSVFAWVIHDHRNGTEKPIYKAGMTSYIPVTTMKRERYYSFCVGMVERPSGLRRPHFSLVPTELEDTLTFGHVRC